MADFLAANPRDVIVIGMSNINCGDKEEARQQLLQVRGGSVHTMSHNNVWLNAIASVVVIK